MRLRVTIAPKAGKEYFIRYGDGSFESVVYRESKAKNKDRIVLHEVDVTILSDTELREVGLITSGEFVVVDDWMGYLIAKPMKLLNNQYLLRTEDWSIKIKGTYIEVLNEMPYDEDDEDEDVVDETDAV